MVAKRALRRLEHRNDAAPARGSRPRLAAVLNALPKCATCAASGSRKSIFGIRISPARGIIWKLAKSPACSSAAGFACLTMPLSYSLSFASGDTSS